MRGIESAFEAVIGQDVELKISKAGKPYVSFSAVVEQGESGQWLRVGCFSDTAEKLAAQAKKGDRIYCEGNLTLNSWESPAGETKQGLNVAAWKVERLGCIGRNRFENPRLGSASHSGEARPDEDKPLLPIALPAIRKKKYGLFRKKAKTIAQDSSDKAQDYSENERPFDDALPF